MRYITTFPQRELIVIGQIIGSVKAYGSVLGDHADDAPADQYEVDPGKADVAEAEFVYEEFLSEVDQLSNQLAVVALYVLCEKTLKRIAERDFSVKAVAFNLGELSTCFKSNNIDITAIKGYDAVNEVRLLSNSIKHSGLVSPELSKKYPSYVQGAAIHVASADFDNHYLRCKDFLHHVCSL